MTADQGQDLRPAPEGPQQPGAPAPATVRGTGRRAFWLGLAGLLMNFIPLLGLVAAIPAVAAIIQGVRARRWGRRTQARVPGALAGVIMGAVGLVLFVSSVTLQVVLYQEIQSYNKCTNAANTIEGKDRCKDQFARDFEQRFGLSEGTIKGSDIPF